jgi:glycosyltransferase involved in cell wall biosynthesis
MNSVSSKRILYGITKSNFGGAQRYVYEVALNSRNRGYQVAVLLGGEGILKDKLEAEGIEVFTLKKLGRDISILSDIRSFFSILKILYTWKPYVFHINSSKMGIMGALAGRIMFVPRVIFTAHGWAFNENRPDYVKSILKLIYWKIIFLCHNTICVSEGTKNAVANWPLVKDKLIVVRNGIKEFEMTDRETARHDLGVHEEDMLLVGTMAELHHIKGLDVLLHAWREFLGNHKAHLVLVGEGEEREALETLTENLKIKDSITFKGFVDNSRKLLSAFDIFVLPSRSEALSYVILEAGVANLPVIATAVGGIPEIIEDGQNGILVPPEDPEMLSLSLTLLAENTELRKKFGENLKQKISQEFSMDKMISDTLKLYE